MNLGVLISGAIGRYADRPALIDDTRVLTYRDFGGLR